MAQRIKRVALAQSIAFKASVEQADENMWLLEAVVPTLEVPRVPYPANTGRLPFYQAERVAAVAAERSHVGIFCRSREIIVHLKRVDIWNRTGAAVAVGMRREDGVVNAVASAAGVLPTYIDAGPDIIAASEVAIVNATPAAGAVLGASLWGSAEVPVLDDEVVSIPLECYIQGGTLWLVAALVAVTLEVAFYGEIIPTIQGQAPG